MGHFLADHAAGADRGVGGRWRRRQARLRGNDGHEEDRRRRHQGSTARLKATPLVTWRVGALTAPAALLLLIILLLPPLIILAGALPLIAGRRRGRRIVGLEEREEAIAPPPA